MRPAGLVILSTVLGAIAMWTIASGLGVGRPSLAATVRALHRNELHQRLDEHEAGRGRRARPGELFAGLLGRAIGGSDRLEMNGRARSALRLVDRSPASHVGYLAIAALIGLAVPTIVGAVLSATGVVEGIDLAMPLGVGLLVALAAPVLVHSITLERASEIRLDMRHQLSAFVDMVTMLLAGNAGHEGALRSAAEAGDGRLFRELRRRMREVGATGRSLVDALELVAEDFDLDELSQIAATARLSAAEGAPVARSLAAKCATLRSTLAADQEAAARVRTDKITPPLVGMTVLFMAVIIYPALDL